MAGDWIKMRTDLWDDPRVVRIMSACDADRLRVIGALYRTWSLADQYTADGNLIGYTSEILDRFVEVDGWAAALEAVGWLSATPQGVVIPRFTKHNGRSAKRRAQENERKNSVRIMSACDADKKRPREEKRREETSSKKKKSSAEFPAALDTDRFRTVWGEWEQYRVSIRKTLTPATRERQLARLAKMGEPTAIATIDQSIEQGWIGLFSQKGKEARHARVGDI
jgi:hypothetical protein